ncbi:MAG: acyl-CoA dehydrogenase family protein [Thermodesulfobacteriota bacterium]
MDFEYSNEQMDLKKEVSAFAKAAAADPKRIQEEMDSTFSWDIYKQISEKGWTGILVPKEYGGQGKGAMEYSIIMEETAKELIPGPQTAVQAQKSILTVGTEAQKRRYLPKLASGEYISAQAISEPTVGSSFKDIKTQAVKDGKFYHIKGHKTHINLAEEADVFILLALTSKGITEFLIEKSTPGVTFKKANPFGLRSAPIYDVYLDCRVPEEQLLGREGGALEIFLATFNLSRIGNASTFIGYARGCLELAINYAKQRVVGKNHVADFQGIQWIIADLASQIQATGLIRDKAAWMADQGREHSLDTSMAKYLAGEVAEKVVNKSFSLVGSRACYVGSRFEQYLRDVKALQVGGGTSEIMKNNIAREVLMANSL